MTNTVEPITRQRRKQLKTLMREVKAASPSVEDDLKAYESALSAVEAENEKLREALEEVAGKNDNN